MTQLLTRVTRGATARTGGLHARLCFVAFVEEGSSTMTSYDVTSHLLCDVTVMGVFPSLVVKDARCCRGSKKQLWTLFSLDELVPSVYGSNCEK